MCYLYIVAHFWVSSITQGMREQLRYHNNNLLITSRLIVIECAQLRSMSALKSQAMILTHILFAVIICVFN